ncbi:MAG: anthranilate synthase component I [Firmicutes bacterium]|nr:anthranilate synthase component I [Bacillota bacterium]
MQCTPGPAEFASLARTANVIPVLREVIADTDTPVSALAKLGWGPHTFLLESVEGGETLGRYSFLGNTALATFRSRGREVIITGPNGTVRETAADPLKRLEELLSGYRVPGLPGLPRFFGGAVGYVGYDAVRFIERLPGGPRDELNTPDMAFLITDTVLVFDHVSRRIQVVVNQPVDGDPEGAYKRAVRRVEDVVRRLEREPGLRPLMGIDPRGFHMPRYQSNVEKDVFCRSVQQAKEYIAAGDIFQVVLSQRLTAPLGAHPFDVYRVLRSVNPSPYMFYLDFGDHQLIGSSPEVMVRLDGGKAQLRPIAGTRPRGATPEEDERLAKELLADAKERAEHIMLVDLGRNDLGRVCRYGSVQVDELMTIERYSHVMHIVSNVTGELAEGKTGFDLLRATFPAGTVTGAPKVRAMEIIDELEPSRRGPYAGAVGYFGFSGNMDSCITIRTVLVQGGLAHVQAGAGIVADSNPQAEFDETLNKAKALLKTIALAEEAKG